MVPPMGTLLPAIDMEAFYTAKSAINDLPRKKDGTISIGGITRCLDYLFNEAPAPHDDSSKSRAQIAVALYLRKALNYEERYLHFDKHRPAAQEIIRFLDTYLIPKEQLPPPFLPEKVPERKPLESLDSIRFVGFSDALLTKDEAAPLMKIDDENVPAGTVTITGSEEDINLLEKGLSDMRRYLRTRYNEKGRPVMDITRPVNLKERDVLGRLVQDTFGDLIDDISFCARHLREEVGLRFFPLIAAPYIERNGRDYSVGAVVDIDPRYGIDLGLQKTLYDLAMDRGLALKSYEAEKWSEKCGYGRIRVVIFDGDRGNEIDPPTIEDFKEGAIIGGDVGADTVRGARYGFELVEKYSSRTAAEKVAQAIAKIVSHAHNIEEGKKCRDVAVGWKR